tara:strand:+ start:4337 stop:4591 length:255 start_codon:yes stop_codon:yes gene_type:complete
MTEPTKAEQAEMIALVQRTHAWIDELQIAGMGENAIVAGIQAALVERLLRAGGVVRACAHLQGQADMVHQIGDAMLADIRAQGR